MVKYHIIEGYKDGFLNILREYSESGWQIVHVNSFPASGTNVKYTALIKKESVTCPKCYGAGIITNPDKDSTVRTIICDLCNNAKED